jgi:CRP-like cAMP-binding protein
MFFEVTGVNNGQYLSGISLDQSVTNMALMENQEHRLDLRGVPAAEHPARACVAFADLLEKQTLYVTCDYEPWALRYQFDEQFVDDFVWSQRRIGGGRWEVALRRLDRAESRDPILNFVSRCSVFADISATSQAALSRIAVPRSIGRKRFISGQDADWPFLGAVREGRVVAVAGTPEGRDQILFEVPPLEIFGDIIVSDSGTTMARFVTFSEPAELLLFARDEVLKLAAADAALALSLARSCAQRTRALTELLCAHISKPILARVAGALIPHATPAAGMAAIHPQSAASVRLGQVTAKVGTVKEVVARAFAQLESAGAIKRVQGRIAFIDRAELAKFL